MVGTTHRTWTNACGGRSLVQERWRAYAETEAPVSVPRWRWESEIKRALEWLHSDELADELVRMVCEVQCLLAPYLAARKEMHLLYKVVRCETPAELARDAPRQEAVVRGARGGARGRACVHGHCAGGAGVDGRGVKRAPGGPKCVMCDCGRS